MKFLMIVLAVRFILSLLDKKPKTTEQEEERNEVRDPAAYQLR